MGFTDIDTSIELVKRDAILTDTTIPRHAYSITILINAQGLAYLANYKYIRN